MPDTTQSQIRQRMATQRRAMPSSTVSHCAGRFPLLIDSFGPFAEARHVAGYHAVRNEASPEQLLIQARQLDKITYLPIVCGETLRFAPIDENTPFIKGEFGIPIPDIANTALVEAKALDLIIMPLLAFDDSGHRIGMGGGFYDKTLAGLDKNSQKPLLLGLGYEWQRVSALPANPWDVPLHAALTEAALHDFRA